MTAQFDFVHQLESPVQETKKPAKTWFLYSGLGLALFLLVVFGGKFYFENQNSSLSSSSGEITQDSAMTDAPIDAETSTANNPTRLAVLNQPAELGSPVEQAVAGVSTENDQSRSTNFGVVGQESQADSTSFSCKNHQLIFTIGEKETSAKANPVDEFNWLGSMDELGEYANPFVADQHSDSQFPWRTNFNQSINIEFQTPSDLLAQLSLGWLAGLSGEKSIAVYLDGQKITSTPRHTGELGDGWQHMTQVEDKLNFPISSGSHLLTLKPYTSGEAIIWDYLQMTGCN